MTNARISIVDEIRARLNQLANPNDAIFLQRFFKTAPGQYGHGDIFIGVRVPATRRLLGQYKRLTAEEVVPLLLSTVHEERLFGLLALVRAFEKGDEATRQNIYQLYLEHTRQINNWDLVDVSAPHIVGAFLSDKTREPLYQMIRSCILWDRRIAILATFYFIRRNQFGDTLELSHMLLRDKEDLIHKAAGWMLREVGKRDQCVLEKFLKQHCREMPRTMLRYAIEKFSPELRRVYLDG
jgi:3-methyladenine DNA glycosylase AlkD